MLKIGIVTVTYNSTQVIEPFLECLLAQTFTEWELFIIDSNSADATREKVKRYSDSRINLICQKTNVGFAKGSNLGIQAALNRQYSGVMLINNDVEFKPDFLDLMKQEFQIQATEIVAPKMLYHKPANRIWCAGGGFNPKHAWAAVHYGLEATDNGQFDKNVYCDFVPLCCALIKPAVFARIGLLDERYFLYSEDADWFYRAKLAGIKLMYCHKPALWHKVSSLTGGSLSYIGSYYGTRNRVYFIRKHFKGQQRRIYLFKYFVGMFWALWSRKYTWQEFCWRFPAFLKGLKY